jgi:hypothetical protein
MQGSSGDDEQTAVASGRPVREITTGDFELVDMLIPRVHLTHVQTSFPC